MERKLPMGSKKYETLSVQNINPGVAVGNSKWRQTLRYFTLLSLLLGLGTVAGPWANSARAADDCDGDKECQCNEKTGDFTFCNNDCKNSACPENADGSQDFNNDTCACEQADCDKNPKKFFDSKAMKCMPLPRCPNNIVPDPDDLGACCAADQHSDDGVHCCDNRRDHPPGQTFDKGTGTCVSCVLDPAGNCPCGLGACDPAPMDAGMRTAPDPTPTPTGCMTDKQCKDNHTSDLKTCASKKGKDKSACTTQANSTLKKCQADSKTCIANDPNAPCKNKNQVKVNGKCVNKAKCKKGQLYQQDTNTCADDPNAPCANKAQVKVNGKCVKKAVCKKGQKYDPDTNTCPVDPDAPCPNKNQVKLNGACVKKTVCKKNQKYDPATNTCPVDPDAPCPNKNQIKRNGNCEKKAVCKKGQKYDAATNTCPMDPEAPCPNASQVRVNGNCVKKVKCNRTHPTYDPVTNTCH